MATRPARPARQPGRQDSQAEKAARQKRMPGQNGCQAEKDASPKRLPGRKGCQADRAARVTQTIPIIFDRELRSGSGPKKGKVVVVVVLLLGHFRNLGKNRQEST